MVDKNRENISIDKFITTIFLLNDLRLSHVDLYHQKIDLHFGEYRQDADLTSGDFVLYVTGFWEALKSNSKIVDENSTQDEIQNYFASQVGSTVRKISVNKESRDFYFELSSGDTLHFNGNNERHSWIELLKRNGELFAPEDDGNFIRCNPNGTLL